MVSKAADRVSLSLIHQNKQVKINLEFPEQSDRKAEQEFISRLKAIYFGKIRPFPASFKEEQINE